jgi:NTP pyrophosphatase (non-canonical NTP hydrolase)
MTPNEYQKAAARTLIDGPERSLTDNEMMIVWNAIGLAGEAGEVVDHIKKGIFHRHGLNQTQLVKEIGDVMWYVAGLCTKLGINLEDVMQQNIDKLLERYPDGYSSEASINRVKE